MVTHMNHLGLSINVNMLDNLDEIVIPHIVNAYSKYIGQSRRDRDSSYSECI